MRPVGTREKMRVTQWLTPALPPSASHSGTWVTPGGHRMGTGTCDTKLDLLRVMAQSVATTAIDASILCPKRADDQGAVRLQLVPEGQGGEIHS